MAKSPDEFIEDLFRQDNPEEEFYPGSKRRRREKTEPKRMDSAGIYGDHPWDHRPLRLMVDGVEHEFFTIGALAQALNRRPVTIRSWEAKGVMPKARFRDRRSRRVYSRRQVEGLIQIAKEEGVLDFDVRPDRIPVSFTEKVTKLWTLPL